MANPTRLYVMPALTGTRNGALWRHPKYDTLFPSATQSQYVDFGDEPWFLVAVDLTDADDLLVVVNADVLAIPVSTLDVALTAAGVTAVQTKLEAAHIPAHWVTVGMTRRHVLSVVIRMLHVWQRLQGLKADGQPLFAGAITLETMLGGLAVGARNFLSTAATSFGIDTNQFTTATTIRVFLVACAQSLFPNGILLQDVQL